MSDKDTGGSAFPQHNAETIRLNQVVNNGMTLRDYFAAKAMQGISVGNNYDKWELLAHDAYCLADAMLKARENSNV